MTHKALIRQLQISCLGLDPIDPLRLLVDDVIAALAQPQRTGVGLTEEEIEQLHTAWVLGGGFRKLCNAIEAKLKEKNGFAEEKNT
jgi:hypothetical protein